jgi:hypothetical protein
MRRATRWATRWALLMGGMPWPVMAIVTWIAVLPIIVVVSGWIGAPLLPMWICAGAAGVVAVLFVRRRDLPFTPEEKRLAARAVLTGAGTGDPDIDGYALRLLDTRKRMGVSENIALSVVMLLLLAGPILASITSSAWWLLMLPFEAALGASLGPSLAIDIDENISRIEAAIAPENEPT